MGNSTLNKVWTSVVIHPDDKLQSVYKELTGKDYRLGSICASVVGREDQFVRTSVEQNHATDLYYISWLGITTSMGTTYRDDGPAVYQQTESASHSGLELQFSWVRKGFNCHSGPLPKGITEEEFKNPDTLEEAWRKLHASVDAKVEAALKKAKIQAERRKKKSLSRVYVEVVQMIGRQAADELLEQAYWGSLVRDVHNK
jgi:hypothetical protein